MTTTFRESAYLANALSAFQSDSRPLIVYHDNCMDGRVAAWAVLRKHPTPENVERLPQSYNSTPLDPEMVRKRCVVIVDFCYPADILNSLSDVAASVVVIDHHVGHIDALREWAGIEDNETMPSCRDLTQVRRKLNIAWVFETAFSGAALAWMAFNTEDMPELVAYVQDRDLWHWRLPDSKAINAELRMYHAYTPSYLMTYEAALVNFNRKSPSYFAMLIRGETILAVESDVVSHLIETGARLVRFCGHEVWACSAPPMFASEVGHVLSERRPALFSVTWWEGKGGMWTCSLRSSRGGMDVNEIAKSFGGGGHEHAAGFVIYPPIAGLNGLDPSPRPRGLEVR